MAKFSTFTDNFATKDASKWAWHSDGASGLSGVSNGQLFLSYLSGVGGGGYIDTVNTYDLSNSFFAFQYITDTRMQYDGSNAGWLQINNEDNWGGPGLYTAYESTNDHKIYASAIVEGQLESTGITLTAGMFVRIRHDGTTVYWEYSTNNGTSWTSWYSKAASTFQTYGGPLDWTSMRVRIMNWNGSSFDHDGTLVLDNVNLVPAAPTVATSAASNIAATSARLNGNVSSDGNSTITARGFDLQIYEAPFWNTIASPSVSGTTGSFVYNASGLTAETQYRYAAWATNAIGTTYGSFVTFTTAPASVTVNDTRSAKITGKDTTSNTRSATIRGALATSDQRNAQIAGRDTSSAQRAATIAGQDGAAADRSATITGFLPVATTDRQASVAGGDGRHIESFDDTDGRGAGTTAAWNGTGEVGMA